MSTLTETRAVDGQKNAGPGSGVTAHLTTPDAMRAIAFYKTAFGAHEEFRAMDDGSDRVMHAHLKINGGSVYITDDFPEYRGGTPAPAPASVCLHLQVEDADAWFERAVTAGAAVEMPLENMFWGDRYGRVRDPWGHTWSIAAPIKSD